MKRDEGKKVSAMMYLAPIFSIYSPPLADGWGSEGHCHGFFFFFFVRLWRESVCFERRFEEGRKGGKGERGSTYLPNLNLPTWLFSFFYKRKPGFVYNE